MSTNRTPPPRAPASNMRSAAESNKESEADHNTAGNMDSREPKSKLNCCKCSITVKPEESLKCAQCHQIFHYQCAGVADDGFRKILPMNKPKWKCSSCKIPKKAGSPQITIHRAESPGDGHRPTSIINIDAAGLMAYMDKKFDALTEHFTSFKKSVSDQLNTLTSTVNTWELRIQHLESKAEEMSQCITALKRRELDLMSQTSTITALQDKLSSTEQHSLRNELEISGMTEQKNESLTHSILLVAHKIGVALSENDIDTVTRVGPTLSDGTPRPVVARLLRNMKRNELVHAARVRKNLKTNDIDLPGEKRDIFLNERLTKANRSLFRECRERAKTYKYDYCWVRNGIIHVRKEHRKPAKVIRSVSDIDRLIGPAPAVTGAPGLPPQATPLHDSVSAS